MSQLVSLAPFELRKRFLKILNKKPLAFLDDFVALGFQSVADVFDAAGVLGVEFAACFQRWPIQSNPFLRVNIQVIAESLLVYLSERDGRESDYVEWGILVTTTFRRCGPKSIVSDPTHARSAFCR